MTTSPGPGATWPVEPSPPAPLASEGDLRRWREAALAICDEADRQAMAWFRQAMAIETKPDRTLVTEVDRSIERLARARLRSSFPGCGLVGEEEGEDSSGASLSWIVDPIDGTSNFVRGIPVFATLLAATLDGEPQLAVASAPALGQRWLAWRGGGAWCGERRLAVSRISRLADAQLVYGSRTDDLRSGFMPGLDATLAGAWRERGFGDFWGYMLVAEGAAEAMVETGAQPWDLAAPLVIVEEAGGRLTTVDGERTIRGRSSVASNGRLHEALLESLRRGP